LFQTWFYSSPSQTKLCILLRAKRLLSRSLSFNQFLSVQNPFDFAERHGRPYGTAPIQSLAGSDPGTHQSHLQARMLPLFRHSGNLSSSSSSPLIFPLFKKREDSLVGKEKCYASSCWLASFPFRFPEVSLP
jgi:hypothetical protein